MVHERKISSVVPIYRLLSEKENTTGTVDLTWLYCIANVFVIQRFYCAGFFPGLCSSGGLLHLSLNSSCCGCEDGDVLNVTGVAFC